MISVEVALAGLIAATVLYLTNKLVNYLYERIERVDTEKPEPVICVERMSAYDRQMAKETADAIRKITGPDPVAYFKERNEREKLEAVETITSSLIELYGLQGVQLQFMGFENKEKAGLYVASERTLYVNVGYLLGDYSSLDEEKRQALENYLIYDTIDTIVHELRHAVQFYALEAAANDQTFWQVDEETLVQWAVNYLDGNYIYPIDDPKGYYYQTVEVDAATFAFISLEGVKHE